MAPTPHGVHYFAHSLPNVEDVRVDFVGVFWQMCNTGSLLQPNSDATALRLPDGCATCCKQTNSSWSVIDRTRWSAKFFMRQTSVDTANVMQDRTVTPASPALVLYCWKFCRNSPHGSGSELVSRGGRAWTLLRCSPQRIATRSALTFNCSAAGCSPLAAGCSPLGVQSILVLGLWCAYYASSLLLVVSLFLLDVVPVGVGFRLHSHSITIVPNIACGSSRHGGCGHALGSTV